MPLPGACLHNQVLSTLRRAGRLALTGDMLRRGSAATPDTTTYNELFDATSRFSWPFSGPQHGGSVFLGGVSIGGDDGVVAREFSPTVLRRMSRPRVWNTITIYTMVICRWTTGGGSRVVASTHFSV